MARGVHVTRVMQELANMLFVISFDGMAVFGSLCLLYGVSRTLFQHYFGAEAPSAAAE